MRLRRRREEADPRLSSRGVEMWFAPAGETPERVVLFHHIPKTAGSSLRVLMRENLAPLAHVREPFPFSHRPSPELGEFYRNLYASLAAERRRSLVCVTGHGANYLLDEIEAPVEALTVLREPVDFAVSWFHFHRRTNHPERAAKLPTLESVYERLSGATPGVKGVATRSTPYFNGQARSLLASHHDVSALALSDGPPPDADLWRERLFELVETRYWVGTRERFAEFAGAVAERYGWRAFVPLEKVNPGRPAVEELPEGTRQLIRSHNWLDVELHARYASAATRAGMSPASSSTRRTVA